MPRDIHPHKAVVPQLRPEGLPHHSGCASSGSSCGAEWGHSPGHRWVPHCRYSSWGPWQAAPPKKGPKQARSLRCVPPPHVTLQPPHDAQACHFPSTAGHSHAWRHEDGDEGRAGATGTQGRGAGSGRKLTPGRGRQSSA